MTEHEAPEQHPSRLELVAYSLPSAPTSMLMMMLIVYLAPYYAAEMGMELAAVGAVFAMARIWDAVIDPVVGNVRPNPRPVWTSQALDCGRAPVFVGDHLSVFAAT